MLNIPRSTSPFATSSTPPAIACISVTFGLTASAMPSCVIMRASAAPVCPPPAGSGMTIERARSSVVRTPSAVEMSGSGAPSRTTRPTPTRARSTLPAGRSTPVRTKESMMGAGRITISGASPPENSCWMIAGFATVNTTRCPLSRVNCAANTFSTSAGAPELKTLISAAVALPARHTASATQTPRAVLPCDAPVSVFIPSLSRNVGDGRRDRR